MNFGRRLLLIALVCAAIAPLRGEVATAAQWIWYPESIKESENQHRWFCRSFILAAAPKSGELRFAADDSSRVWINGREVGGTGFKTLAVPASALAAGRNTVAVRVRNARGPAGLLMYGEITLADGTAVVLATDAAWKSSRAEVPGWNAAGFLPGDGWVAAAVVRGVDAPHVWRKLIARRDFMSRREFEASERDSTENEAETRRFMAEVPKRLAAETTPSVKVVSRNGVSGFLADGKFYPALIYKAAAIRAGATEGRERIRRYAAAGFHLYQISATQANDFHKNVNHEIVRERLLGVLGADPEARLIVGIGLDPGASWGMANPDEVVGYGSGCAVKAGSDMMRGTPLLPSFASLKWRKEAGAAVRKLIRELEASPYGKRILGYQFNYGVYSEWHTFGMWNNLPDTGVAMTNAYRRFLKAKYGTDEALRKAWGNPAATIEGATPPAKEKRLRRGCFALRDPAAEREVLDFDECQADEVNAAQFHFARIAKEETQGRKIVGFYSGYFFGNGFPVSAWQPKTPEVLQSELVDYQASPYVYSQRRMGLTSLPRAVIDTYPLQGRMSIFESDTRPHFLRGDPRQKNVTHTFSTEEDITALSRDFAQAITHGAGFWLYDFSLNNWFARPEFLPMLRQFGRIAAAGLDCRRVSEAAFVCDFGSVPLQHSAAEGNPLPSQLAGGNAVELSYAGAPFDTILTEDLLAGRAPEYKLYIFSNLVRSTPELEKLAADLRAKGKTIVWLYAPGLVSERGIDPAGIAKLTGVKVAMIREKLTMGSKLADSDDPAVAGLGGTALPTLEEGPVFFIDDPAVKALGNWKYDGKPVVTFGAKRIGKSLTLYSAAPLLTRELFRNIMKAAGVHLYTADTKDVLFANRSLVGIHTVTGGGKTLRLPRKARRVTRVLPDEAVVAENTDMVTFVTPKTATVLFRVEY